MSIYAAVGIHPHDAAKVPKDYIEKLKNLAKEKKVVAIGEIGLDYYYDFSPRDTQKEIFARQIELALEINLPMIIHTRESMGDTFNILDSTGGWKAGGVFHCFPGDLNDAKYLITKGFYISYTGVITFKNADKTRTIIKDIPLDRLLIETDSPYMAPEPYRGERNRPALVIKVAETIATIKNISLDEVGQITTNNFNRLFNL
jgi:TatD DNase family protein